jgi:hypothetical protein
MRWSDSIACSALTMATIAALAGCGQEPDVPPGPVHMAVGTVEATVVRDPDGHLNDVWASPDGQAFAVGDNGVLRHFDGAQWHAMNGGTLNPLNAVRGRTSADVYAAGEKVVIHYDGAHWTRLPDGNPEGSNYYAAVLPDEAGGVCVAASGFRWAVSYHDGIGGGSGGQWHELTWDSKQASPGTSSAALNEWSKWFEQGDDYGPVDLAGTGHEHLYVLDRDYWEDGCCNIAVLGTLRRFDGQKWVGLWSGDHCLHSALWVSPTDDIMTIGPVCYLTGRDTTWVHADLPFDVHPRDIWGAAADDIYAAGYAGVAHYDGAAWIRIECGTSSHLRAVSGVPGGDVFAVGEDGTVARGRDGAWSAQTIGDVRTVRSLWGRAANDIYAVCESARGDVILHYDGQGWQLQHLEAARRLNAIWGAPTGPIFVVGAPALILRNDGAGWQETPNPAAVSAGAIFGCAPDTIYAVGSGIWRYDGADWALVDTGFPVLELVSVWCGRGGRVVAVGHTSAYASGYSSAILTFDGSTWSQMLGTGWTGDLTEWVWGFDDDDVYVAGWSSTLMHFDGREWSVIGLGILPAYGCSWHVAGHGGDVLSLVASCDQIIQRVGASWTSYRTDNLAGSRPMRAVWYAPDGDLYCAGDGGVVLRYSF